MSEFEDLRAQMNRRGRRMTPQRRAILGALQATRSHPRAEDILADVQRGNPSIALGTVYRNLQVLVEEGLALRLPATGAGHRYDGDTSEHHHIVCEVCGEVADIHLDRTPSILREVARRTGYDVRDGGALFQGICPNCRANGWELSR